MRATAYSRPSEPHDWVTKTLKRLGSLTGGNGFPVDEQGFSLDEMEIPFFKVKDLQAPLTLNETDNYVSRDTATRLGATIFPQSTIVFAKVGAALLLNRFRILGCEGCIDNNMMAFQLRGKGDVAFFRYALDGVDLSANFNQGPVPSVNTRQIGSIAITVPPFAEQQRIAAYLDASCAAIDAAVAAKRRQVEALDALCGSVLLHALTEDIHAGAALQDTGSVLLPQIPVGWRLERLKDIATVRYGLGQPPAQLDSGVAMIRATDVDAGRIRTDNLMRVDPQELPAERNPYLKAGEIIVVRSGAYTGDSAIIPVELEGCVAGYDMVVTVERASPRFVAYCLLCRYVLEGQILLLTLRAAQPHLNTEELGSVFLALPPNRSEQDAIAAYLDEKLGEVRQVSRGIQRQIETLVAYRKSLIHECVTGQRRVTEADMVRMQNCDAPA